MGRASQQQAAENRAKVVAAASQLFRRRGLDGVAIAELMAEAGLTHGGFYGQFGSKDVLAGEACAHAFDSVAQAWATADHDETIGWLQRVAGFYLRQKPPGWECPMATLAGDAARAPAQGPVRQAFTAGLRRLAGLLAGETRADRALAVLAAMVGASVLRRASDDAALADQIDAAVLHLAATSEAPTA